MYIVLIAAMLIIEIVVLILILVKNGDNESLKNDIARQSESLERTMKLFSDTVSQNQKNASQLQKERLDEISKT